MAFSNIYNSIGTSGFSGYSGIGTSGYSGAVGTSGYSGISGYSGYSGVSGYQGFSGNSAPILQSILYGNSFSPGNVIYKTSGGYALAKANSIYTSDAIGIVQTATVSSFDLIINGYISGLTGLTDSYQYYLSDAVAGALTDIRPSANGSVIKPMLIATSTSTGIVVEYASVLIGSTNAGTSGYLAKWTGLQDIGTSVISESGSLVTINGNLSIVGSFDLSGIPVVGISGYSGNSGYQGFQGYQGTSGYSGYSGRSGYQGFQGSQGAQGNQGNAGNQGAQGVQGNQGFQGVQGTNGTLGSQGTGGTSGYQGYQGYQGIQGTGGGGGAQGTVGTSGYQGFQGRQGNQGNQGNNGGNGAQGNQGNQGSGGGTGGTGAQGAAGSNGAQGSAGTNGSNGGNGAQGAQGSAGSNGSQGSAGGFSSGSNAQVNSLGVGTGPSGTTGEIRATGDITAYYSDQRLKDNIKAINEPLHKLQKISGVYYTQNKLAEQFGYQDYREQVGVLAQDVQRVLPHVVKPAPFDMDENNQSKTGENYVTVQYERLVPLLIEAIKELSSQVQELSAKTKL